MASVGSDTSEPRSGAGTTRSETEAAPEKVGKLTDLARAKAGELKQQAKETAHDMRERASSAVDQQKHAVVGRVEGVARALRTASDDLREQGQPLIAEYSRYAAEGLDSMARSLDQRDVDDLVGGVEDFARHRPVVFLGGALFVGFALARFMKSSSARRYRRSAHASQPRPATAGMAATPAGGASTPETWNPGTPGAGGYGRSEHGGL
jgi:hypothetical protein